MRTQSIAAAAALLLQLHGAAAAPLFEAGVGGGDITTADCRPDDPSSCYGWDPAQDRAWPGEGGAQSVELHRDTLVPPGTVTVNRRVAPPCVPGDDGECHVPEGWSPQMSHGGGMMPSLALPAAESGGAADQQEEGQGERKKKRFTLLPGEAPVDTPPQVGDARLHVGRSDGGAQEGKKSEILFEEPGPGPQVSSSNTRTDLSPGRLSHCPYVARRSDGSWGCSECIYGPCDGGEVM